MLITFFGKRGAGKTTTIRGQLQHCPGPVVVIDILGNYSKESLESNGIESFQTDEISAAIEFIENWVNQDDSAEKEKNKIVVIQTHDPSMCVDYMSATLWQAHQGTLVLDEADAFDFSEAPCYDQIIRYGRNRNVHVITGVRRPAELSRNISAAANQMYAFGTHEPRDVEYFSKTIFGPKAEELIRAPKYSGIFVDYDQGIIGNFRIDIRGNIFQTKTEQI